MTLDCLFRNPMQSRVISGGSCYLTSYGYLTFYWFAFTTRSTYRISISDIQLSLPRVNFAVHPRLWGSVLLCDLMLPVTSCGICVTRLYTLSYQLISYWGSELTVGLRRSCFISLAFLVPLEFFSAFGSWFLFSLPNSHEFFLVRRVLTRFSECHIADLEF